MNKLPERLTEALSGINISRREFARRIGVTEHMLYDYCNGRGRPSIDTLILMCNELGETADYLIGRID